MPPLSKNLSLEESRLLNECENDIAQGLATFLIVGRALATIRDLKLYRREFATFDKYCKKRWNFTRGHAYRLIGTSSLQQILEPSGVLPESEGQVRALQRLPEDQRLEAWQEAIKTAEGKQISARHVERAVQRRLPDNALVPYFGEALMNFPDLHRAPINEMGVVFLFGVVSKRLGFEVEAVHAAFPDCVAKRLVDPARKRWKQVAIEFEFRSRNFVNHGHNTEHCDLIVCWIHDWPECPIDVISLKDQIDEWGTRA